MKVLVSVDIEGISGIANTREYEHFSFGREWITADTNAAIEGALEGGATIVTVSDTHGAHNDNILFDQLHPKARLIRGGKNTPLYFMEGLTEDTDLALLVGWHDKARGPGVLAHTFAFEQRMGDIRINGIVCGEVEIAAGVAGHFGVPIGFISGDDVTCREASAFLGDIETACVKRAIDRYAADCLPLAQARELIRQKARRAVARAREFRPYQFASPFTLEWDCSDHNIANILARVPSAELVQPNTARYTNQDFGEMFNMLITWRTLLRAASVPN
ncbi:MAG: M55 family metallopeptidase [Anaerolineales bacterium]|nr:M55 family metallopeptidase [Anaerolineales bacterium]